MADNPGDTFGFSCKDQSGISTIIYLSMLIVDTVYWLKTQIPRKEKPISVMMFYGMVLVLVIDYDEKWQDHYLRYLLC